MECVFFLFLADTMGENGGSGKCVVFRSFYHQLRCEQEEQVLSVDISFSFSSFSIWMRENGHGGRCDAMGPLTILSFLLTLSETTKITFSVAQFIVRYQRAGFFIAEEVIQYCQVIGLCHLGHFSTNTSINTVCEGAVFIGRSQHEVW